MSKDLEDIVQRIYKKSILESRIKNDGIIAVVDFTLPSIKKRFEIRNMKTGEVLLHTYVTHGKNSGDLYPLNFSNINGSLQSSLGVFKTGETYIGKHGESLKVDGLDGPFNDNARARSIVIHKADYIGNGRTGRSWGCFAVPVDRIKEVIKLLKGNHLLIAYYPDKNWLTKSKWLH